jgi:hypothetical protein
MKVAIQGLGEVPTSVLLVLKRERPEITYVICSDYQLKYVAKRAGFDKSNEEVIKEAATKAKTKVIFRRCDVFDPSSVGKVLGDILDQLDPYKDEVVINYTGGTAVVRLLLGTLGMIISTTMNVKIIYAIKYRRGVEIAKDHTRVLRDIQQTWTVKKRELGLAPEKIRQTQLAIIEKLEKHFAIFKQPPELEKYKKILVPKGKITYGEVFKPLKMRRKKKEKIQNPS